jgi:hypothetical protein
MSDIGERGSFLSLSNFLLECGGRERRRTKTNDGKRRRREEMKINDGGGS